MLRESEPPAPADVHLLHLEHSFGEIPAHFQDSVSIGVLKNGACSLTTRSGHWTAATGDVIVLNALEPHAGKWLAKLSHYAVLHIGRNWFEHRLPGIDARDVVNQTVWSVPWLSQAVQDTLGLFHPSGQASANVRHSRLAALIARIGSMPRDPLKHLTGPQGGLNGPFADQLDSATRVQDLAGRTGKSRYAVYRQVRSKAGIGPARYLRFLRVAEAKRLILSGVRLADAAAACGFADQSHFTRAFREAYGVAPKVFLASRNY